MCAFQHDPGEGINTVLTFYIQKTTAHPKSSCDASALR